MNIINIKPFLIGISGVSRSGKDTLYKVLESEFSKNGYKCRNFALATELKNICSEYVKNQYGLDVFSEITSEKNIFRQYLVDTSFQYRDFTKGQYFYSKIEKGVNDCLENGVVPIITDVRFAEYKGTDEMYILKRSGILIHVTRKLQNGETVKPANSVEEKNDPILRDNADVVIEWNTMIDESTGEVILSDELKNQIFMKVINAAKLRFLRN